jgi:hypothetical protein
MRRNLSTLAASILNRTLLQSSDQLQAATGDQGPDRAPDDVVRMNPASPRLTDNNTITHPHRPRGHGA